MTTEDSIKDWQRIYDSITKPEEKEAARREYLKKTRSEQKKKDTGI